MIQKLFPIIFLSGCLSSLVYSNPGGESVYKQLCSACHGVDGNGAGGGTFPPLNGSEWLKGSPDRVAQILLHGLTGPIAVKGKSYDLMMPPQGNLTEQQSVDVINYVIEKWGDKKSGYTLASFKKASEKSSKRAEAWTADELLKLYPLPVKDGDKAHVTNLLMHFYKGVWKVMPDFTKVEVEATEEEHDGFISLEKINQKDYFGVVWEGELQITKNGEYEFELNADDAARIVINGKQVVEVAGLGPMSRKRMRTGKIQLKEGLNDFRFEYLQNSGGMDLQARFREVKSKEWSWLSKKDQFKNTGPNYPVIDLTPENGRVRIYNNFIKGSSARGLAVGFPEKNHYSYSPDRGTVDVLWTGKFISGGRHWTRRGQGDEGPLGEVIHELSKKKQSWKSGGRDAEIQYLGYMLSEDGNPAFKYTVNGIQVVDRMSVTSEGFKRQIKFETKPPKSTYLVLSDDVNAKVSGSEAIVSKEFSISVASRNGSMKSTGKQVQLTNLSSNLTIEYQWKK